MPMASGAIQLAVPDGWRVVRLGEVASRRREQVKPEKNDPQPYVALEHIVSGGALSGHGRAGESISNKTLFKKGDTLYGKLRPNLRKVIRAEFGGVCSTDILAIFGSEQVGDPFLSHLLRSDLIHQYAMQGVAGTKMPRTSWNHLSRFEFPMPPLAEQRGIAAVLDAIDEAIERSEAVIAATEELRRSLLHELLSRGVPGWHSEWREVRGLGVVPACWEVVRLGEVCQRPEYGAGASARPFDPALPRYVRITDITDDGRLRAGDARSADPSEVDGYELEPGDLLFARSGATVGKTYLHRQSDGPCVYAGYLIRFQALPDAALPEFLDLWTRSDFYRRWVASMLRAGAQPNINAAEYSSLPVALPPLEEQRVIADALERVDAAITRTHISTDVLGSLKVAAADVLLSGRVRTMLGSKRGVTT